MEEKEGFSVTGVNYKLDSMVYAQAKLDLEFVKVKEEPDISENAMTVLSATDPIAIKDEQIYQLSEHESQLTDLYQEHDVKDDIVIGPTILQKNYNSELPKTIHQSQEPFARKRRDWIYHCYLCNMQHTRSIDLLSHMKEAHSNDKIPVNITNDYEYLEIHVQNSNECNIYSNKNFQKKMNLRKHTKTGYKVITSATKKIVWYYNCYPCNQKYKDSSDLIKHIVDTHSGDQINYCTICNITFEKTKNFDIHMSNHVSDKMKTSAYEAECSSNFEEKLNCSNIFQITYKCHTCKKIFQKKSNLYDHIRNHHIKESKWVWLTRGAHILQKERNPFVSPISQFN